MSSRTDRWQWRERNLVAVLCLATALLMTSGAHAQAPGLTVTATASPTGLAPPGGMFTFAVTVVNGGPGPVTLTALTDDVYGDLAGQGSCTTGAVLAAGGGSYACSFAASVTGEAGTSRTSVVTATAVDDGGAGATASGETSVSMSAPALPPKGARFAFHDHQTVGRKWHVEFRVAAQNPTLIQTLVVYSEQCKATIAEKGVPISSAGVIAATGSLKGGGTWEVQAAFTAPTVLAGTMRMTRPACDSGPLAYPNAITGDGHTDHAHAGADADAGGGHDHGQLYPDFGAASPAQRAQARALHVEVRKRWRSVTRADARRLGFVRPDRGHALRGRMFHLYNRRYEMDGRSFDAARPESLVYWRVPSGDPVLLGLMFRVPPGPRPSFAGPIPLYHSHASTNPSAAPSEMTHVWLVAGSRSAWAGCLPVQQLQQYNPAFEWVPDRPRAHIGAACP